MEITWLGHSCFRLRAKEATVVTDPCDRSTGYSIGKPHADIVTVSNDDPGHSNVGGVGGTPRVIDGAGEFEISRTSIVGVGTGRDAAKADSGGNIVFVIELEDMRICHLGGITSVPTSDQLEEMSSVDILLVPVGGGAALDAPVAAEAVTLIEPKLVIPMHYKTDAEKGKLDPLERFLKEMGVDGRDKHAKLSVTRSSLPGETQVLVVDYKR
jgi:L-ascorbate metabolism protein UlaG (beta-lactamase superfamily)